MIDFKPAVRFLKLDKMGEKCAEVGKNIAAYAKHHRAYTAMLSGMLIFSGFVEPTLPIIFGPVSIWAINGAGKFDRMRDEGNKILGARARLHGFAEGRSQPVDYSARPFL